MDGLQRIEEAQVDLADIHNRFSLGLFEVRP
jgi:hypothetical protein